MIEWGQKSKPKKIPGPKVAPRKSHAEFPSLRNFQKGLNDITRNKTLEIECLVFVYSSYHLNLSSIQSESFPHLVVILTTLEKSSGSTITLMTTLNKNITRT